MKKILFYIALLVISIGCKDQMEIKKSNEIKQNQFAIIIHGGAGTILKKNMSPEKEKVYKNKLKEAIQVGYAILKNGGTSQNAVMKTIQVMEESPLFNAGKGRVLKMKKRMN